MGGRDSVFEHSPRETGCNGIFLPKLPCSHQFIELDSRLWAQCCESLGIERRRHPLCEEK